MVGLFVDIMRRVLVDRRGAAMIEYALLAALIAVVAISALTSVGSSVRGKFNIISSAL